MAQEEIVEPAADCRRGGIVMRKIIADMHMHTLASGHAYGTIREMGRLHVKRGFI